MHKISLLLNNHPTILIFLLACCPMAAYSLEPSALSESPTICDRPPVETAIGSAQASAGVMYNLVEHPESIRAVTKTLLREATEVTSQNKLDDCAPDCGTDRRLIFRVVPNKFLPKEQQDGMCMKLDEQTAEKPLLYTPPLFSSLKDFDAWLTNFTQGKGVEGKLLYEQCGGDCDPIYKFVIEPHGEELSVSAEVHCSFIRDRDDGDMYTISTAAGPGCIAATP